MYPLVPVLAPHLKASIQFIGSQEDIGDTPYSFSGFNVGVPSRNRIIIAGIGGEAGGGISSCTIGGVTATQISSPGTPAGFARAYYVVDETNSTVTVAYSTPSTNNRTACGVWVVRNALSTTPLSEDTSSGTSGTRTVTLNLRWGAVGFAVCTEANVVTFGWNDSFTTEEYETTTSENNSTFGGATLLASGSTTQLVTCTLTGTTSSNQIVGATWR